MEGSPQERELTRAYRLACYREGRNPGSYKQSELQYLPERLCD